MEKRISIYVDECKHGMKIAQNIFNDYGAIVVAENSIIDENTVKRLAGFGIEKLLVYQNVDENSSAETDWQNENIQASPINENKEEIRDARNEFKEEYKENVDTLKNVLKDISSGKDLKITQIDDIVNTVLQNKLPPGDLMSCVNEIRNVDEYTYTHSVNVALLCMMIGKWLKCDEKSIKDLVYSGLLHDIGKAKIDLEILNKPGKLTDEEYNEIKKHVLYGYRILEKIPNMDKNILSAVLMHHERDDGSGYIIGAKTEEVHLYAKIVAVADVFDAMTSKRVYRERISPFEVFEYMQTQLYGKFDPKITLVFLSNMADYYVGDKCILSNGQEGEIIKINPSMISKPLVKVGDQYIDLSRNSNLKINDVI